jgi:ATP-dependent Clp protease ATP-binding subunit ClpA
VPRAEEELDRPAGSRLTRPARRALAGAQDRARDAGAAEVDTGHVLVALLDQPGTAGVQALVAVGANPVALRGAAAGAPGGNAGEPGPGQPPFGADCRRARRLAQRHALRLDSAGVTTGHLLLGLIDTEGRARTVLLDTGVRTDAVQDWLRRSDPAASGEAP